jgi:hypothetical protein
MNERKKCKMELIIERINWKYESSDDDRNGILHYVEGIIDFGAGELEPCDIDNLKMWSLLDFVEQDSSIKIVNKAYELKFVPTLK